MHCFFLPNILTEGFAAVFATGLALDCAQSFATQLDQGVATEIATSLVEATLAPTRAARLAVGLALNRYRAIV